MTQPQQLVTLKELEALYGTEWVEAEEGSDKWSVKPDYRYSFNRLAPDPDMIIRREDLPEWLLDAHVRWTWEYDNWPEVIFKMAYSPTGPNQELRFYHEQGSKVWLGTNADGTAGQCHYHGGTVSQIQLPKRVGWLEGEPDWKKHPKDGGAITVPETVWATTQQEGYAGRTFQVHMADDSPHLPGEIVHLRGPWHGGSPPGWMQFTAVDWSEQQNKRPYVKGGDWTHHMACFGYMMPLDLWVKAVWYFLPHIPLGIVTRGDNADPWPRLEVLDPVTQMPKYFCPPNKCPGHEFTTKRDVCNHCRLPKKTLIAAQAVQAFYMGNGLLSGQDES